MDQCFKCWTHQVCSVVNVMKMTLFFAFVVCFELIHLKIQSINQRRIQNFIKHLRWSFFELGIYFLKQIKYFLHFYFKSVRLSNPVNEKSACRKVTTLLEHLDFLVLVISVCQTCYKYIFLYYLRYVCSNFWLNDKTEKRNFLC